MKKGLIYYLITITILLVACQDRRIYDEKLILEQTIKEFTKYHQREINQGKNILLIGKGEIRQYEREIIENHYKLAQYPEWELLITDFINAQCGKTDTSRLFNLIDSEVVLESVYHKADSAYIFGALGFTNICFNEDYTRAVTYVSFMCGNECGSSSVFLFQKENEKWSYVGELGLWVS